MFELWIHAEDYATLLEVAAEADEDRSPLRTLHEVVQVHGGDGFDVVTEGDLPPRGYAALVSREDTGEMRGLHATLAIVPTSEDEFTVSVMAWDDLPAPPWQTMN